MCVSLTFPSAALTVAVASTPDRLQADSVELLQLHHFNAGQTNPRTGETSPSIGEQMAGLKTLQVTAFHRTFTVCHCFHHLSFAALLLDLSPPCTAFP